MRAGEVVVGGGGGRGVYRGYSICFIEYCLEGMVKLGFAWDGVCSGLYICLMRLNVVWIWV